MYRIKQLSSTLACALVRIIHERPGGGRKGTVLTVPSRAAPKIPLVPRRERIVLTIRSRRGTVRWNGGPLSAGLKPRPSANIPYFMNNPD
jgi:hypothetical protein